LHQIAGLEMPRAGVSDNVMKAESVINRFYIYSLL